jgi:hypothetical protein
MRRLAVVVAVLIAVARPRRNGCATPQPTSPAPTLDGPNLRAPARADAPGQAGHIGAVAPGRADDFQYRRGLEAR